MLADWESNLGSAMWQETASWRSWAAQRRFSRQISNTVMQAVAVPLKCSHLALQVAQLLFEGLELFLKRGDGCSLALGPQADLLLRRDFEQLGSCQSDLLIVGMCACCQCCSAAFCESASGSC